MAAVLRQFEVITAENREPRTENLVSLREQNAIRLWLGSSPHTQRAYAKVLRDFLAITDYGSIAEACRDYATGTAAVRAFTENSADRSYSIRNVRYSALRKLLRLCEAERVYPDPVSHLVPAANRTPDERRQRRSIDCPDWKTCLRVIAAEPDPRNRLILRTLLNTGLRAAELAGALRVDLEPCITEDGTRTLRLWVVGKGDKDRWVTLRAENAAELSQWIGANDRGESLLGLSEAQIRRVCRNAWARRGVDGGRLGSAAHLFRHAWTTNALRAAENHGVSENLGHSRTATTTENYDHRVPNPPTAHLPWQ